MTDIQFQIFRNGLVWHFEIFVDRAHHRMEGSAQDVIDFVESLKQEYPRSILVRPILANTITHIRSHTRIQGE